MGDYVPHSEADLRVMMDAVGVASERELYRDVPEGLLLSGIPGMGEGKSEAETDRAMKAVAGKNRVFSTVLRGAGAYRHYIPAVVSEVVGKETFLTAYTPYQAEISQGVLQSIFEYQTGICELTGMDVSNASVYDGATAAAEACAMCRDRKRNVVLVSATADPQVREVMATYGWAAGSVPQEVPAKDGRIDTQALGVMLEAGNVAAVYVPQLNYYGLVEDCAATAEIAHAAGAKFIMGVDPMAAAVLVSAGECGADIAVGEGQALGMPLSYGGPYLGFMATRTELMRKLPGRIVGQTVDHDGRRTYVLTLQAREQHIRREKASSNICSNEALCAMTASVYLSAMGPEGLKNVALQSASKAHYLAEKLCEIPGVTLRHEGEFFYEFVTDQTCGAEDILKALQKEDILGGLPLSDGGILWCATEVVTKEELDKAAAIVRKVVTGA